MSDEEQATNKPAEENAGSAAGAASQDSTCCSQTQETLKMSTEDMVKRRSQWQSSLAAMRYISSVHQDTQVKVRDTDKATQMALAVVCVATLALILAATFIPALESQQIPFVLICDALVGAVLIMYVGNRFGIVTTFTPRQAVLTWQLMFGASLLGIFLAINLIAIIGLVLANTPPIEVPGAREAGVPVRRLPKVEPLVKVTPNSTANPATAPTDSPPSGL